MYSGSGIDENSPFVMQIVEAMRPLVGVIRVQRLGNMVSKKLVQSMIGFFLIEPSQMVFHLQMQ
jgi:hypothetical protein